MTLKEIVKIERINTEFQRHSKKLLRRKFDNGSLKINLQIFNNVRHEKHITLDDKKSLIMKFVCKLLQSAIGIKSLEIDLMFSNDCIDTSRIMNGVKINFEDLKKVDFQESRNKKNCQYNDIFFKEFFFLQNKIDIVIFRNVLITENTFTYTNLTKITQLHFYECKFQDAFLETNYLGLMGNLEKLTIIDENAENIKGLMKNLKSEKIKYLKIYSFKYNREVEEIKEFLKIQKHLKILIIEKTRITFDLMANINCNIIDLRIITVDVQSSNMIITNLSRFKELKNLSLTLKYKTDNFFKTLV